MEEHRRLGAEARDERDLAGEDLFDRELEERPRVAAGILGVEERGLGKAVGDRLGGPDDRL